MTSAKLFAWANNSQIKEINTDHKIKTQHTISPGERPNDIVNNGEVLHKL